MVLENPLPSCFFKFFLNFWLYRLAALKLTKLATEARFFRRLLVLDETETSLFIETFDSDRKE